MPSMNGKRNLLRRIPAPAISAPMTKRYAAISRSFRTAVGGRTAQKLRKFATKIADMFKEQKTFEIVDDNRQKRREKENNAKEQKTLDEIGTNAYIKRKKQ